MLKLILSDLHISAGNPPGEINPYEDFHYDSALAEFLAHHSSDDCETRDVELILNGDFLDPLKVDIHGSFPDRITQAVAVQKVSRILEGHPVIVQSLRAFLARPGKTLTYVLGNHDLEVAFPAVQELFRSVIGAPRFHDRIRFRIDEPHYDLPGGVRVLHGNQFEALNRVDSDSLFLSSGYPEPILNLPWGSIFLLKVLLPIKAQRPYINLVHPFTRYLTGAMLTDSRVAIPATARAFYYFLKTRFFEARRRAVSFRHTLRILREEAVLTPDLEDMAIEILDENPMLNAVIMGHSHGAKIRRYPPRGAIYVNTGTWTKLISLDLSDLGVHTRFTYAVVDYRDGPDHPRVGLFRWFGEQKPWSELKY